MTAIEQSFSSMTSDLLPTPRLFSTDLDGTLVGRRESEDRFSATWRSIDRRSRPLLVYNSGRRVRDVQSVVRARQLPEPDYIIGGVGTELYDGRKRCLVEEFSRHFGRGWDLENVEEIMN